MLLSNYTIETVPSQTHISRHSQTYSNLGFVFCYCLAAYADHFVFVCQQLIYSPYNKESDVRFRKEFGSITFISLSEKILNLHRGVIYAAVP